ncbi:MAG: helix-turn-helix domain-containing protein [Deltaproteobacteria bacterium]|jgi:hypothetical protein|nr:helix-turn-helix domain-containing protein [Deltaproteobacteria bacterium]
MNNKMRRGLDNPHPFWKMKTELIWEGKYDEYGNRRAVYVAGCVMPLQKIESVDEPASHAHVQTLSRIFAKMSSQNLIEINGRKIKLLDRSSLEDLAEHGKL